VDYNGKQLCVTRYINQADLSTLLKIFALAVTQLFQSRLIIQMVGNYPLSLFTNIYTNYHGLSYMRMHTCCVLIC